MSIILEDVSSTCKPFVYHYGEYLDQIIHFNYKFNDGKLYLIYNDFGEGGWALTHFLAGFYKGDILNKNKVIYNNEIMNQSMLQKNVCYVGNIPFDIKKKILKFRYTVIKQLENGIKKSKKNLKNIIEIFGLSEYKRKGSRIYRKLENVSQELWRATMAIGFAYNKKIFVFPQVTKMLANRFFDKIMLNILNKLKKEKCIIIIPTIYKEKLKNLIDITIDLNKYHAEDGKYICKKFNSY